MQNIYILDGNSQEAIGIYNPELPDGCPFMNDVRTERLEYGFLTLEFDVPANHPTAQLLVNENLIVYPDLDGKYELYRIKNTKGTTADGKYLKSVLAENSAVTDLLASVIRPASFPSTNLKTVMNTILNGTGWTAGSVPSNDNKDFAFDDYISALEALHQALSFFDAEISFNVEFDGLRVTRRYVDVGKRGTETLKPFVYGIDLVDVTREENTDDIYTAVIGKGKTLENGSTVTLANYSPPGLDTTKYTKDFAADWIGSKDAFTQFALNGRHRETVHKDDNAETQYDLYLSTLAKLDELSKPKNTYTVNVVLLEKQLGESHKVRLGDTILVKDQTYEPEILLQARIIETKTSIIDPNANTVVLGDYVEILQTNSSRVDSLLNQLAQNAEQWNKAITTAQAALTTGAHVIANAPIFEQIRGDYYSDGGHYSLEITVTDKVHLDSCTIYCEFDDTNGVVALRGPDDTILETREFTGLMLGANTIKLDFLLTPDGITGGQYRLSGLWDKNVFRRSDEIGPESYPYSSGAFTVTGTTSGLGYWYWFFDLKIGGANVNGGYGSTFQVGSISNALGTMELLNDTGEAILVADNEQVSIGVANIGKVVSESVVNYSDDDFTYYVNAVTGDDENDGLTSSTPFASVKRALQLIPRFCDGNVNIFLESDINEPVTILGYTGLNAITIYGGTRTGASAPFTYTHYTITGKVTIDSTTKRVNLFYGRYFPDLNGFGTGSSDSTIFAAKSSYVYLRELYTSGRVAGTTNYNTNAIGSNDNSLVYVSSCHIQDWRSQAFRAANFGKIHLEFVTGNTTQAGGIVGNATGGGAIVHENAGTNVLLNLTNVTYPQSPTANVLSSDRGGTIQGVAIPGTPITSNGTAGTSTGTPSVTPTTFTVSSNNSGRTYRYTVYVGWRSEAQVMEGSYGYGFHKGLWFFPSVGSTPPWVGKTIKEISITVTRLREGGGAGTVRFKTHNYLTQPAGNPTIGSAYVPAYFAYGDKKTVRLDGNATIKSAFANNTAKGIAIDGGDYAIFSPQATLKVVYQ